MIHTSAQSEYANLYAGRDTLLASKIVRRRWTFKRKGKLGMPGISSDFDALIVRLVKDNPHKGYDKIHG
jgi:hypothetical protein